MQHRQTCYITKVRSIHKVVLKFNNWLLCLHINIAFTHELHLLINIRSPRDYVGLPFVHSFALSPLDGASVREAHCEQANIAVRFAHCVQTTVARLVTFESLKWKYSFATNSALFINNALFMKLGSLLYVRCRHRSAKSTAV